MEIKELRDAVPKGQMDWREITDTMRLTHFATGYLKGDSEPGQNRENESEDGKR